jgi:uncharacterized protein
MKSGANAMRAIITGGTGFQGKYLITELANAGYEVIVLSRHPDQYKLKLPDGVRLEWWDAKSSQGWGSLADGADAIVNLAGENMAAGRWTEKSKQEIRSSRVNAGKAIVQSIEQVPNKPKVVIQASAVGYYGTREDQKISEDSPPGNDFQASVCLDWEASTAPVDRMGVRRVVIRTGLPLATDGGVLERFLLPFKLYAGGPLGSGKQWIPWIHMADQVGAIRFLIENPGLSGAFNLCSPNPVTNKQLAQAIGKAMGRPSILPVPGFAMKLVFGQMADEMLLVGWRELPDRLLKAGYRFRFPEIDPALRDLLKD